MTFEGPAGLEVPRGWIDDRRTVMDEYWVWTTSRTVDLGYEQWLILEAEPSRRVRLILGGDWIADGCGSGVRRPAVETLGRPDAGPGRRVDPPLAPEGAIRGRLRAGRPRWAEVIHARLRAVFARVVGVSP
jgi:hypothetical protein